MQSTSKGQHQGRWEYHREKKENDPQHKKKYKGRNIINIQKNFTLDRTLLEELSYVGWYFTLLALHMCCLLSVCLYMHMMQQGPGYIAIEPLWITKAKDNTYPTRHIWHTKAE